jgi:hypothetical protein
MIGREWERQGEKDPEEEFSNLTEKYSSESMMAEENDDGNQDEEALLENEGTESGEESRTFDPEDSEVHSEEHGESKGCNGCDGGEDNNVFCEQLEDVMMGKMKMQMQILMLKKARKWLRPSQAKEQH